jgi:hypothetical protein
VGTAPALSAIIIAGTAAALFLTRMLCAGPPGMMRLAGGWGLRCCHWRR